MPVITGYIEPKVFNAAFLPLINDDTDEQVFAGGAGSGKSKFIFQRMVLDLMDSTKGNRNYLVVRKTARSHRDSTFNEAIQAVNKFQMSDEVEINKSDLTITSKTTRRQAIFRGLDDTDKLKSVVPAVGVLTDILIEEANEITETDYDDVCLRTRGFAADVKKRVTLCLNPVNVLHWIYKRFIQPWPGYAYQPVFRPHDKLLIHHSCHKDNAFLTDQDHAKYESYKEKSPYHYEVYGLGHWGTLGGAILTNYVIEDLSELYAGFEDHMYNGLDFGFSSDEAALVRAGVKGDDVYIFDIPIYQTGLQNNQLAEKCKESCGSQVIVCDSAEPKSIDELQRCGVSATGAIKGKDSVRHGAQWLQQKKIHIDATRALPIRNEIQQWQWAQDRYGNRLPDPVGVNDHAISALRYALERVMVGGDLIQVF